MVETCDKNRNINSIVKRLPPSVTSHMYRVGLLTSILAEIIAGKHPNLFGQCGSELRFYGISAFYHDVGKAFIPRELLLKPDSFSKAEMEKMRNHTVIAKTIFDDAERGLVTGIPRHLIELARNSAVYHHEWWNGNGYPYGIGYEDIPLVARITSVCDAYDAMTSNRPYRPACSHDEACRELEAYSGMQFDPELVGLFLNNEGEFSELLSCGRV